VQFLEGWPRFSDPQGQENGAAAMQTGIALMHSQQQGVYSPLKMTPLAETEAEAGRPEAALAIVDKQLATTEQTGQHWYDSEIHGVREEILLQSGDEAAAKSALKHPQNRSAKLFELQAAAGLGRPRLTQGKRAHAREVVAPVCAWFDAEPDCNALSQARVLSRNLGAM